jgi:ArsR family transcriptional regulator
MPGKSTPINLKFRAFSDPTRLRILFLLLEGEMCVCDLAEIIRAPQPTASRHLAYLRRAGLVTTEKRGFWTYYALAPAKTPFEKSLRECLRRAGGEDPEFARDKARKSRLKNSCC